MNELMTAVTRVAASDAAFMTRPREMSSALREIGIVFDDPDRHGIYDAYLHEFWMHVEVEK